MKKSIILALVVLLSYSSYAQKLTVAENKQNVVALALEGTWSKDNVEISFSKNNSITKILPDRYTTLLSQNIIYQAGYLTVKQKGKAEKKHPYLLTNYNGNPHLFYFRPKGDDPLGDSESFNLYIARGKTTSTDILIISGDFAHEEGKQYKRVSK